MTDDATSDDDFELVRGSGNVYADLGMPDSDLRQLRAILAAEIGRTLTDERISVREAQVRTGVAAADFSRIRKAKLGGFTVDRLMTILDRLGREVRIDVSIVPRTSGASHLQPAH